MSTIRVDNFGPSAGGTTYSARGIAKAWVSFTTFQITVVRGSENISSLTDAGVGDTTINFTNYFAVSGEYAGVGGQTTTSGGSVVSTGPTIGVAEQLTASSRFLCVNNTGTNDRDYQAASYHGDLA